MDETSAPDRVRCCALDPELAGPCLRPAALVASVEMPGLGAESTSLFPEMIAADAWSFPFEVPICQHCFKRWTAFRRLAYGELP